MRIHELVYYSCPARCACAARLSLSSTEDSNDANVLAVESFVLLMVGAIFFSGVGVLCADAPITSLLGFSPGREILRPLIVCNDTLFAAAAEVNWTIALFFFCQPVLSLSSHG